MELLLDQNLSDQLVVLLADLFPNSTHVKTIGLDTATDTELWDYARETTILSFQRIQTSGIEVLFSVTLQK